VLRVAVTGEVNRETGFVMDYADLKKCVQPIVDALDHRHLGTFALPGGQAPLALYQWKPEGPDIHYPNEIYPSSENLLWWIAGQLHGLDLYRIKRFKQDPEIRSFRPGEIIPFEEREKIDVISRWSYIQLNETCTSSAILCRDEFNALQR
jgi:6-pyruvoyl-tetrahydropterin synthase